MKEVTAYQVLSPRECKTLIDEEKELIIIDARTQLEHDFEGKLENSILIDALKPRLFKKEVSQLDRDAKYLVYCAVGNAAKTACNEMLALGFKNLYFMEGGLKKWQEDHSLVTTVSKLDPEELIERRKKIVVRINKLEGQLAGVKRMLLEGEYCGDILNQSLAVRSALKGVNKEIMEMFSESCITTPEQKEDFYRYLNKLI